MTSRPKNVRCAETIVPDIEGPDFSVEVALPGTVMGVFFIMEKPKVHVPGKNGSRIRPVLVFDTDPTQVKVTKHYIFVPVDATFDNDSVISPIGVYQIPNGEVMALYESLP